MDRNLYKNLLMERLQRYFDIEEEIQYGTIRLSFHAKMHRRNEKYVLTRKNILYAYDNFEYFSLFQAEELSLLEVKQLMEDFVSESVLRTIPNEEHMSSDHVLIAHVDRAEEDVRNFAKKYRHRKYYQFGLKGSLMTGLILVIDHPQTIVFSRDLKDKKYHFVLEK